MSLKNLFLLDPQVTFLNHGSFGACPRPVMEIYHQWQHRLERQPVQFLANDLTAHLAHARQILGQLINAPAGDLVFVPNATYAVNLVARSLQLQEGDEVLATNHEYGACQFTWQFLSQKRGFRYVEQAIPLPVRSDEELVEQFWQGVTPRTKVIFISHITSPTALCLPIAAICARARQQDILTVVDGAHAVGQLDLDMAAIGADFYTSNAHKWLCAPKGSAFLYTRPERQPLIEPLVVSWGWGKNRTTHSGSDYLDYLEWSGTMDPSAYLSVPAAIEFQAEHNWPAVRHQCHQFVIQAIARIGELTGREAIAPPHFYHQMAAAPLPPISDLPAFKARLYHDYQIEIPCTTWQNWQFIRISMQGYNDQQDVDTLLAALSKLLG